MRNTSNFFSFPISFVFCVLIITSFKVKADVYEMPLRIEKCDSES